MIFIHYKPPSLLAERTSSQRSNAKNPFAHRLYTQRTRLLVADFYVPAAAEKLMRYTRNIAVHLSGGILMNYINIIIAPPSSIGSLIILLVWLLSVSLPHSFSWFVDTNKLKLPSRPISTSKLILSYFN